MARANRIAPTLALSVLLCGCRICRQDSTRLPARIEDGFRRRVSSSATEVYCDTALCALGKASPGGGIGLLTLDADTKQAVPFASSSLGRQWYAKTRCLGIFRDVERRHLFSWLLALSDCTATVMLTQQRAQPRHSVVIRDRKQMPEGHPYFNCWREQTGDWRKNICDALETRYVPKTSSLPLAQLLLDIATTKRISFIFAPDTNMAQKMHSNVKLAPREQTAGEVLSQALAQLALDSRPQGGVVYVFRDSESR